MPGVTPRLPGLAPDYAARIGPEGQGWLRKALGGLAHGADLRRGAWVCDEEAVLASWYAAGWIAPEGFAPDLAARAFALCNGGGPSAARTLQARKGPDPRAYWWGPGPEAAAAWASLPPAPSLQPGDLVEYTRHFLRSTGQAADPRPRWRVLEVRDGRVVVSLPRPEPCPCGDTCPHCGGTGQRSTRTIAAVHLQKVLD